MIIRVNKNALLEILNEKDGFPIPKDNLQDDPDRFRDRYSGFPLDDGRGSGFARYIQL